MILRALIILALLFPQNPTGPTAGIVTGKPSGGGGGPSAFAYVAGSVTGLYWVSGSFTTKSYALHLTPGAGHLLVAIADWASNTATASISDPNNGIWTAIGSPKVGTGSLAGFSGQMFYVAAASNAATTVSITISSAVTFSMFEVAEYSYTGSISGTDGAPTYSNVTSVASVATINGSATSFGSDLLFAGCLGTDTKCTTGSGFTGHNDTNAKDANSGTTGNDLQAITGSLLEEKTGVGAGSQVATFGTAGATDNSTLGLVAF